MRMTPDQLEFAINQYLDGTLGPLERAALKERLRDDADARALLEDYRRLDNLVKTTAVATIPSVNWDRLAGSILDALAKEELPVAKVYSLKWVRLASVGAVAAALLVAVGLALRLIPIGTSPTDPVVVNPPAQPLAVPAVVLAVAGPQVERSEGAVVEISIGPAAVASNDRAPWHVGDLVVARPSRVIVLTTAGAPVEPSSLPY
ncbi:MAG: anti-sigma factor family protein [Tepidisphaeraceae bacterium]